MQTKLLVLYCLVIGSVRAQEIRLKLMDSLSQESIPFATVLTNFDENTISNEEGVFRLTKESAFAKKDSIFISCMGYTPLAKPLINSKIPLF